MKEADPLLLSFPAAFLGSTGRVGSTTAPELWDKKTNNHETYRKLADIACTELFKPDACMPSCPRYLTHTDPFLAEQEASVFCTLSHFQQKPYQERDTCAAMTYKRLQPAREMLAPSSKGCHVVLFPWAG